MDIVKDILLTDCFLVKCFIDTGAWRLSDFLEKPERTYIPAANVTMIDLEEGKEVSAPEVLIRRDEIIVAHELLDFSQDRNLRNLADPKFFSQAVDLYHTGGVGIEIHGNMQPGAFEGLEREKAFFVLLDVTIHGLDEEVSPTFGILSSLTYAIVNRERIGYIFRRGG